MARLSHEGRINLPKGDFVFPKQRSFPIDTPARARDALSRVDDPGHSEAERAKVREAVHDRYPGITQSKGKYAESGEKKETKREKRDADDKKKRK